MGLDVETWSSVSPVCQEARCCAGTASGRGSCPRMCRRERAEDLGAAPHKHPEASLCTPSPRQSRADDGLPAVHTAHQCLRLLLGLGLRRNRRDKVGVQRRREQVRMHAAGGSPVLKLQVTTRAGRWRLGGRGAEGRRWGGACVHMCAPWADLADAFRPLDHDPKGLNASAVDPWAVRSPY